MLTSIDYISLLFIVALPLQYLVAKSSSGSGAWVKGSDVTLLFLLAAYGLFFLIGNGYLLYNSYTWHSFLLINLPALVFISSILSYQIKKYPPNLAFTLVLADEQGNPLANQPVIFKYGGQQKTKITNKKGLFFWFSTPFYRTSKSTSFEIHREGFYPSFCDAAYIENSKISGRWPLKHYSPWNQKIHVTLKKIENPIPLLARDLINFDNMHLLDEKEHAYDFLVGDWLPPVGRGRIADIIFKLAPLNKRTRSYSSLLLTFPGKGNGVKPFETDIFNYSLLKLPRLAPTSNYHSSIKLTNRNHRNFTSNWYSRNKSAQENYFFRIRTKSNSNSCLYGKITSPIALFEDNYHNFKNEYKLHLHYF